MPETPKGKNNGQRNEISKSRSKRPAFPPNNFDDLFEAPFTEIPDTPPQRRRRHRTSRTAHDNDNRPKLRIVE